MIFDPELICVAAKCASRLKGKEKAAAYDRVGFLEEAWHAACDLSRGPDKGRNAHWHRRAGEIKDEIEAFIDRGGIEEAKHENRIARYAK